MKPTMYITITGKRGAGKTTLSKKIANLLVRDGFNVQVTDGGEVTMAVGGHHMGSVEINVQEG